MTDPLSVLPSKDRKKFDQPDSPRSVGWTRSHRVRLADETDPLPLDCGERLAPVEVEYETYGCLNEKRDNAILILHALSGDAHVAGWDSEVDANGRIWRRNRPGWWDDMVGPGKAFDTRKYCVICSNVLGSCYGTTGPSSLNPVTGRPYGLRFPVITVGDWVRLQKRLIEHLGIERLYAVAGGSLGGQQALEWTLAYPDRVRAAVIIASAARLSDQGLAFNAVARHAITSDPRFCGGDYYDGPSPERGLAIARMLGHITYLSEESMRRKFGRRYRNGSAPSFDFSAEFEVESYLEHQGNAFVQRFDANSYLYMTRAMDYYDAAVWGDGSLDKACGRAKARFLLASFSSDWLYTPKQMQELALALCRNRLPVTYVDVPSSCGHDAFLIETNKFELLVKAFLEQLEQEDVDGDAWSVRRWDHRLIYDLIPPGSSVLDLGCGDGELLSRLMREKGVRGQGVEKDIERVLACVKKGVPAYHADLDEGLTGFPDKFFDYVVLEQTLQAVGKPLLVLEEMLRVGKVGVVSFPNFAHRKVVTSLARKKRMPVTPSLPYRWHETPNIHPLTVGDFIDWARDRGVALEHAYSWTDGKIKPLVSAEANDAEEVLFFVRDAKER